MRGVVRVLVSGLEEEVTPEGLGFHVNCGGRIGQHKEPRVSKSGERHVYVYVICSSCRTIVNPSDIVQERPNFKKQQTSGRRYRRQRYDIKSWKDVK